MLPIGDLINQSSGTESDRHTRLRPEGRAPFAQGVSAAAHSSLIFYITDTARSKAPSGVLQEWRRAIARWAQVVTASLVWAAVLFGLPAGCAVPGEIRPECVGFSMCSRALSAIQRAALRILACSSRRNSSVHAAAMEGR